MSATALWAWFFSMVSLFFFVELVAFLVQGSWPVFAAHGRDFVMKADWYFRAGRFGAASMLYGTAVVAAVAVLFAVPLAFGSAVLTTQYLSGATRLVVKSLIELLAGIPSVVYGLLGVLFLRPFIADFMKPFQPESGDNLLTAGLLVGMMILPTVMSLSDDAFRGVSAEERESALALGLTQEETFFHAVFPRAFPGLVSAVFLGLGRALGETIAVYLVVGRADNRLPDPWYSLRPLFEAGQTLTSKLGGTELSISYGSPEHWAAMLGLGTLLLGVVLFCVLAGQGLLFLGRRYRV